MTPQGYHGYPARTMPPCPAEQYDHWLNESMRNALKTHLDSTGQDLARDCRWWGHVYGVDVADVDRLLRRALEVGVRTLLAEAGTRRLEGRAEVAAQERKEWQTAVMVGA